MSKGITWKRNLSKFINGATKGLLLFIVLMVVLTLMGNDLAGQLFGLVGKLFKTEGSLFKTVIYTFLLLLGLFIILGILKIAYDLVKAKIKKRWLVGTLRRKEIRFEQDVIREFRRAFGMTPFHNLIFPLRNLDTKVVFAFVSDMGVFSIECRCLGEQANRLTPGCGNMGEMWRIVDVYGDVKYEMSPFIQNYENIKAIWEELMRINPELGHKVPIYNVVIVQNVLTCENGFGDQGSFLYYGSLQNDKCCIVSTSSHNPEQFAVSKRGIVQFKEDHDRMAPVLTSDEIAYIGDVLSKHVVTKRELKQYEMRLKQRTNN